VVIILNTGADKIPAEIEQLVKVGVEAGAAISGTVQTANIVMAFCPVPCRCRGKDDLYMVGKGIIR